MKRILFPLVFIVATANLVSLQAQVTIGSNAEPNKDAVLELISNSNKGLLLPRVVLSATTNPAPLSAHVAGMTVYNTTSTGDVPKGYYYNDGSKWVRLTDELHSHSNGLTLSSSNDVKLGGTLTENTTVAQGVNTMAFTSTATNGFSVDGTTLSVDAANNRVGIGTNAPTAKLQIENSGTDPTAIFTGVSTQPATANCAYMSIDNATGQLYKAGQAEKVFYYQTYYLNNVNGDWVQNFDTKIPVADFTVLIVGSYFDQFLKNTAAVATGTDFFTAQNVYAFTQNGTWRLTADFPKVSSATTTGVAVNGNWRIYTMIVRNNQVVTKPDIAVDLGGLNSGSAASPVP